MSVRPSIYSEIGTLKKVMLHRPGRELLNLTPSTMQRLLFDDIPDMSKAALEHDAFADILRRRGVEVIYLTDCLETIFASEAVRSEFLDQFLPEAGIFAERIQPFRSFFLELSVADFVTKIIEGIRLEDIPKLRGNSLCTILRRDSDLLIDPLPNLYFQRDSMTAIGGALSINVMSTVTRRRETLLYKFILTYHPDFQNIPTVYSRDLNYRIEGGDILILSRDIVAIGISQRTQSEAIELMAKHLLSEQSGFSHVLAFQIPQKRAFMHLDTVFTMIDYDVFTIHPEVQEPLTVYDLTRVGEEIKVTPLKDDLAHILSSYLDQARVTLIPCGGGRGIDAEREQWNDGSNTLAIAPGEVVVYERNRVTNRLLAEAGVKLHYLDSGEISRGRGGPRCMSMPLVRL